MLFKESPFLFIETQTIDIQKKEMPNGVIYLKSSSNVETRPFRMTERLIHWAKNKPDRAGLMLCATLEVWPIVGESGHKHSNKSQQKDHHRTDNRQHHWDTGDDGLGRVIGFGGQVNIACFVFHGGFPTTLKIQKGSMNCWYRSDTAQYMLILELLSVFHGNR